MLNQQQNVKQKNVDYKITREEVRKFDKWVTASDEELDSIRELIYKYSLILLKCKKYE